MLALGNQLFYNLVNLQCTIGWHEIKKKTLKGTGNKI